MPVGPLARDDASAPFFDGTARGEFLIRRCPLGHFGEPQREQCGICASTELTWTPAAGGASVVSWSVVHQRARGERPAQQTVLAVAELDEGPWWWSQIVDVEPAEVGIGVRLSIDFERAADHEFVPVFRLTGTTR